MPSHLQCPVRDASRYFILSGLRLLVQVQIERHTRQCFEGFIPVQLCDWHRTEVRIGEVAVVRRILFGAKRDCAVTVQLRVDCSTRPPAAISSRCRVISSLIALAKKRKLLMFLISTRVPSGPPGGPRLTLASQRK